MDIEKMLTFLTCLSLLLIVAIVLLYKSNKTIRHLTYNIKRLTKDNEDWRDSYTNLKESTSFYQKQWELRSEKDKVLKGAGIIHALLNTENDLPSYIKGNPNNRVDTKLFNKLRVIGCENNLIPEILQYLRDVYRIHIYSYGYNGLIQICAIESEFNSYIVNRENTNNYNPTYYECIINGIEEALLLIQDYKLEPNLENRNKINTK